MLLVVKKVIPRFALLFSLFAPAWAHADITDTCSNYVNAQDYARAASEAKHLLQLNLQRTDERAAQLCAGRAYDGMGRAQDALGAFLRVEALSQTTAELAIAYNWLGMTYGDLHDLDKAELYNQRYLKAARDLGDKDAEATALNNLAFVADDRGDQVRALKLYRESLALKPRAQQAATLANIALIHDARKEYKPAITLLRQAIAIDRDNGDTHQTARHQINLGNVLRHNKQYVPAEQELLTGLNAIRLVGDKSWEAQACEKLGWLANDDPKKSIAEVRQWLENAEALYREIGYTDNADRIAQLLAGK